MAKVKLDDVISSLLNEMDSSIHTKRRLFDIAIDVLRELNMDVHGRIKTTLIEVYPNRTVPFPPDYINYIKIGLINAQGEIATFSRNNSLHKYKTYDVADTTNYTMIGVDSNYRNFKFKTDTEECNIFGLGGDMNIGGFTVDEDNRCFAFERGFPYTKIALEYLSNEITDENDEYMVDERLEEAVKAGTFYRSIKRLRQYSRSEKDDARQEWVREKHKGKSRIKTFRINEANDTIRKTIKLALKH